MIAGIEDHTFAEKPDPACEKYCDTVMRVCTGVDALYAERRTCLGVCRDLPKGDPSEVSDEATVSCRTRQAELAEQTREPESYCPQAGPGGGGKCGTICTAYCSLLQDNCPEQFRLLSNCEKACSALKDTGDFDVDANYRGDTLQCRLVHLSTATIDPKGHCSHAQLQPTSPCVEKEDTPLDCQQFCRMNQLVCTGDFAVYESPKQCLAVCAALPQGTSGDRVGNTSACRHFHTYNSLIDPDGHCWHTSAGGDGHCGLDAPDKTGNCVAYCILLETACSSEFSSQYGTQTACQTDCTARGKPFGAPADSLADLVKDVPSGQSKLLSTQTGNTLQCRLLHVSRALSDATECPSALGQGACQ
jgi:hypothetical protein